MIYLHDTVNNVYITAEKDMWNGLYEEVTEEEYLEATTPTEEELRAEKEAQLSQLLRELYPEEYAEEGNNEHTAS